MNPFNLEHRQQNGDVALRFLIPTLLSFFELPVRRFSDYKAPMNYAVNQKRLGNILLVEDDNVSGPYMKRFLEENGFSCCLAQNLEEAIANFQSNTFHAVVTDIFLSSDRDAKEGLRIVKEAGSAGVPVIIMTSAADFEIAHTGLNYGAIHLLEKPFKAESLKQLLENIWEEPKGLASLAERFFEYHSLTKKEKEIARMLLKGLSNREIGEICGNTEKTIKFHLTIIFDKCGVKTRTELFNSIFPT